MPTGYPPSVFVSSTCYDLAQVRSDLRRFVEGLGYEAVISESPAFPVNAQLGPVENCINAVRERTDLFVLIVGARYGTQREDGRSVTNLEYLEAKKRELPIYVFVRNEILHNLPVWKANPHADFSQVVDSTKLFAFVEGLRGEAGHWVYSFEDVSDIVETVRHQWALLFTDAMAQRERLRVAKLSPDLLGLEAPALQLLLEKPVGWEYRFFSRVLRSELEALAPIRRDLQYGLRLGPVVRLGDLQEIVRWTVSQLERVKRLVHSVTALTDIALKEALAPPGKPGNPDLLAYVARRIAEVVHQALRWTSEFASAFVDEDFERLLELTSNFSKD
jgi:Domain of unknown function (DUF4062)